jgi:hypothetical protein
VPDEVCAAECKGRGELLKCLDKGASVKLSCDEHGCGLSTIYNLKKQEYGIKEQLQR